MTEREKLVGLISEVEFPSFAAVIADHLIANGVTFGKDTDVPSKWISVKDKLPEDYKKVLTCDHKGNIHVMFHYSGFQDPFGISKNDSRYHPVTHWMPLPSLPKEE